MLASNDLSRILMNSLQPTRLWVLVLCCAQPHWCAAETPEEKSVLASSSKSEVQKADLRPCSFQGITAGETTAEAVIEKLGKPLDESDADGERTLTYQVEPFERVEMTVFDGVVMSIVLYLKTPAAPTQIEHELELKHVESASVFNEAGQLLGRAYPERGVLMTFDPEAKSHRATQLVLEPIGAELFLLRVQNDSRHRYDRWLNDLNTAKQLDPMNTDTLQLMAETLAKCGRVQESFETVLQVLELVPGNTEMMLLKAESLARLDRIDEARDLAKGIVDDRPEDSLLHARAEKIYGDLLGMGATPDFAQAVEHHLAAIQVAAPLATAKDAGQRRAAKHLLIEAFLGAARDIGAGDWQQQEATTAKWLAGAREISDSLISQEGGDEFTRLQVTLATLATHADMGSNTAPDSLVASMTRDIQRLGESSNDPFFKRELELMKAQGLFDAATIAHGRERPAQAREFATQAVKAIEPVSESRDLLPDERYLAGRLYFFVGSAAAVHDKNHKDAVKWYSKARKYLVADPPSRFAVDISRHAERFVSMGASYFEAGEQDLGIQLTREGLETLKEAAEAGLASDKLLAMPYGNLAAMYKILGRADEARDMAEVAARLSSDGRPNRR